MEGTEEGKGYEVENGLVSDKQAHGDEEGGLGGFLVTVVVIVWFTLALMLWVVF